jgi:hypothetical protein
MKTGRAAAHTLAIVLLGLSMGGPSRAAGSDAPAIADLVRAIQALQDENRALAQRLAALEAEKAERARVGPTAGVPKNDGAERQPARADGAEKSRLEQRVAELELAKAAQEDAVRSIIRDSVSTLGSKINQSVSLGGAFEIVAGRAKDFEGSTETSLAVGAGEIDLEVQVGDWTLGSLAFGYVDGRGEVFQTVDGVPTTVDRLNLKTASVTIGDTQRFPAFARAGRIVLPFGSSTGNVVTDILSIEDPLTVHVFETRRNAVGLGLAFPTPVPTPPTPPVVAPAVRPQWFGPLVGSLGRELGYAPASTPVPPPTPLNPPPSVPPFRAAVYLYQGHDYGDLHPRGFVDHLSATAGFHAQGHCGRPYDELRGFGLCPWTIDVDVDYNSSVFNSQFLETEYRSFLGPIGLVRGMAASVKSAFGPVSVVGEWNGAVNRARFTDDAGKAINIRPTAWQVSVGYQLDWNPWVESIGAQGTFVSIGYSASRDLAGVTALIGDEPRRVGFVPRRRLLFTVGEWVADGLRLAVEYAHDLDYSLSAGGTGRSARGIFTSLTYAW